MLTPVLHRSCVRLAPFAGTLKRHVTQRQHLLAMPIHRSASNKVTLPEPYDTMTLPYGRTLSWSEAGDPNGDPHFLFHGHPGSRLDVFSFKKLGRRLNIRLIAPDRPGMEPRAPPWDRPLRGPRRLGGGPYALACALTIPDTTLTGVGLVSSASPCEAATGEDRKSGWWKTLLDFAKTPCPSLTAWIWEQLVGYVVRDTLTEKGRWMWDDRMARKAKKVVRPGEAVRELSPEQKTPEAIAKRREWQMRKLVEPMAEGARGLVRDAYLIEHPWGLRLEDVRYKPKIQIFHGAKDAIVPVGGVYYMRERLPHWRMIVKGKDNHYSIWQHGEDILTKIMKRHREQ
ncbi:hypothetical protein PG996_013677 [Apiospora saccharicola]|uniref:Uncharacterized protein n=1 Tax=Apiospora saccharicola TaxID=335842 RepID=A0ABR1U652_9PEZI